VPVRQVAVLPTTRLRTAVRRTVYRDSPPCCNAGRMSQTPAPNEGASFTHHAAHLLREHPALAASAALIALALIHVVAVARFDLATAQALLSVSSRTHVLLATAASVLLIVIVAALINPISRTWLFRGFKSDASRTDEIVAGIAMTFGGAAAFARTSPLMVGVLILLAGFVGLHIRKARKEGRVDKHGRVMLKSRRTGAWLLYGQNLLLVFLLLLLFSSPWMPREQVTLTNEEALVGYVMGEQAGQTLILTRDRNVVWKRTPEIQNRRVCGYTRSGWWSTPFRELLIGGYEPCAEASNPAAR
jgi:hypothetical protein